MARTFDSIISDIVTAAEFEPTNSETVAYVDEMVGRMQQAGKVTRIDLHHIITALSQYVPVWGPQSDAGQRIVSLYNQMDRAAASCSLDSPLVILRDDEPQNRWKTYSVQSPDSGQAREAKHEAQSPSTISEREWNTK
jgi:hypothetical protein